MIHSFPTQHLARALRLAAVAAWALLALAASPLRAQDDAPEAVFPERAPGAESIDAKPLPPGTLSRTTYEVLGGALRAILAESGEGMRIGMYVEDADLRIAVVDVNGTDQFSPGAAMQVPTAAVALDSLGPKYRFRTTLSFNGDIVGHTLKGNLIVAGTGDPTIGTVLAKGDKAPTDLFRRWAAEVRRYGIQSVMGAVIADDSYFDDQWEGSDWPLDERGAESLAQVSALSFHGNCVDLTWKTGWRRGKAPECIVSPVRHYAVVHNEVMSAAKASGLHIRLERQGTNNVILASGIMPVRSTCRVRASVNNPSLYFATALRETLLACGVSVYRSRPVLIGEIEDKAGATSGTCPVALHTSPPLADIVPAALRGRDSMTADNLLKAVGKEVAGSGSFASGCAVVQDFFRTRARSEVPERLFDGSGRSQSNAISPRGLAGVVSVMSTHEAAEAFDAGLSHPGEPQLAGWFDALRKEDPTIDKRVWAFASEGRTQMTLVGRVTTKGGARLAFTLMCEQAGFKPDATRSVFEKIVARMAVSPLKRHE